MALPRPSYSALALVRLAYPDPVPSFWVSSHGGGHTDRPLYCVGGALHLFVHSTPAETASQGERFPSVDRISSALQALNPALGRLSAFKFASAIIRSNDSGFPDGPCHAWDIADRALRKADALPAGRRRLMQVVHGLTALVTGGSANA